MKARLVFDRRVIVSEGVFAELVLWEVPNPVPASPHRFKYRLALVANGVCVLRYDNESGKGDHAHIGKIERSYSFVDVDRLIVDFMADVKRWSDDNSHS
jgi:hypothetical protein